MSRLDRTRQVGVRSRFWFWARLLCVNIEVVPKMCDELGESPNAKPKVGDNPNDIVQLLEVL
jgi:hypothetical protein